MCPSTWYNQKIWWVFVYLNFFSVSLHQGGEHLMKNLRLQIHISDLTSLGETNPNNALIKGNSFKLPYICIKFDLPPKIGLMTRA